MCHCHILLHRVANCYTIKGLSSCFDVERLKFTDRLPNRYEWSAHREYSDCNFRAACVTDWKVVFLVYSKGLTKIHHQIPIESKFVSVHTYPATWAKWSYQCTAPKPVTFLKPPGVNCYYFTCISTAST